MIVKYVTKRIFNVVQNKDSGEKERKMEILIAIILEVILPVFILIAVGTLLHRIFSFDLITLSKITSYYLLPVVVFVNLYESDIDQSIFLDILTFQVVFSFILMLVSHLLTKLLRLDRGMTATFKNSVVLINSGNFGLPVSQLVFSSNPIGVTTQIIVMIIQTFITHTYGLFNTIKVKYKSTQVLAELFKTPILYALFLGVIFQVFNIPLPNFIWIPLESVSLSFLPIALFTLGAQVAYINLRKIDFTIIISSISRLLLAPVIALFLIFIFGLEGIIAQSLFIASAFPTSRNSAQMALEYDVYPEFAGHAVLFSTFMSSITVTGIIFLAKIIF